MIYMFERDLLLENKLRPNVHENWGVGTGPWGGQDPKKYGRLLTGFGTKTVTV
jgi:hypothetical protein